MYLLQEDVLNGKMIKLLIQKGIFLILFLTSSCQNKQHIEVSVEEFDGLKRIKKTFYNNNNKDSVIYYNKDSSLYYRYTYKYNKDYTYSYYDSQTKKWVYTFINPKITSRNEFDKSIFQYSFFLFLIAYLHSFIRKKNINFLETNIILEIIISLHVIAIVLFIFAPMFEKVMIIKSLVIGFVFIFKTTLLYRGIFSIWIYVTFIMFHKKMVINYLSLIMIISLIIISLILPFKIH